MKNGSRNDNGMPRKLVIAREAVEAFMKRSINRARKMDRGERIPATFRHTFADPVDFATVLSPARVRVLNAILAKPASVSELAARLRRDPKAVRRDVSMLRSHELVNIREEPNPGHGRRRIIEPRAKKYQLMASIGAD